MTLSKIARYMRCAPSMSGVGVLMDLHSAAEAAAAGAGAGVEHGRPSLAEVLVLVGIQNFFQLYR